MADQWNEHFWMKAVAYLQEDKKTPLPDDEIVWDSRSRIVLKKQKP
jgi:hypothetical protein